MGQGPTGPAEAKDSEKGNMKGFILLLLLVLTWPAILVPPFTIAWIGLVIYTGIVYRSESESESKEVKSE